MTKQISSDFTTRRGLILAASLAVLSWGAVGIECGISLHRSLAEGRSLPAALFFFLRYFSILSVLATAVLMSATVWQLVRRRPLPPASLYAALLVYMIVTGVTYEAMLRRLWSPQGVQFYTDMTMHDIAPILSLVFWFAFAPKQPLRWSDPLRWLEFPAVYFAVTLGAGLLGAHYPYGFLDPDKIGYAGVAENAVTFLAGFYGLGLLVVVAARALTRDRSSPRLTTTVEGR